MQFHTSQTITESGRYAVAAAAVPDVTDILSIYVDRVKKLGETAMLTTARAISGILDLKAGDLVESTGTLNLQRIAD